MSSSRLIKVIFCHAQWHSVLQTYLVFSFAFHVCYSIKYRKASLHFFIEWSNNLHMFLQIFIFYVNFVLNIVGMKAISQRCEFVTSDYKHKLIQALDFRNRFAEKPFICQDLNMPDQIVVSTVQIKSMLVCLFIVLNLKRH